MKKVIQKRLIALLILSLFATSNVLAVQASGSRPIIGPFYRVVVEKEKKEEKETIATITVTGENGYHCNTEYPWTLTPSVESDALFNKKIYNRSDAKVFTKESVVFVVKYSTVDTSNISAKLKMSLCNDKQCKRATIDLVI